MSIGLQRTKIRWRAWKTSCPSASRTSKKKWCWCTSSKYIRSAWMKRVGWSGRMTMFGSMANGSTALTSSTNGHCIFSGDLSQIPGCAETKFMGLRIETDDKRVLIQADDSSRVTNVTVDGQHYLAATDRFDWKWTCFLLLFGMLCGLGIAVGIFSN